MLATAPTRSRTGRVPAAPLPQSKAEVETSLARLGALRSLLAQRADVLDMDIARLKAAYAAEIAPIEADIAALEAQIQAWCEAHRAGLTRNGRVKTVKFENGAVSWKDGKPKVVTTESDAEIIAVLKKLKLGKAFVRIAETIDRQAILKAPDKVAKVSGIKIVSGPETFAISVANVDHKERV